MALTQTNRSTTIFGLLVLILLFPGSIWILVSETKNLLQSVATQRIFIAFDANSGLFIGGPIICVALVPLGVALLLGKTLPPRVVTILNYLIVVSLFVGIAGRLLGTYAVGNYLEHHNYSYCPERSEFGFRARTEGWVLDEGLCAPLPFDLEGMTLRELKDLLAN